MDRLWSNLHRDPKTEYRQRAAEIVMNPHQEHPGEGMALTLGSLVPDFTADSTQAKLEWHRWIGESSVVLFGYPKDFQPVAATELAYLAKTQSEFTQRGVKVAVVSENRVDEHLDFVHDIESTELPDGCPISFPLISDTERTIAESYGMLVSDASDPTAVPHSCRAVFLIGPDKRLKFSILYPTHTGRNIKEILRVLDSLELCEKHGVYTPVNWAPGDPCAVNPSQPDQVAKEKFGKITKINTTSGRNYMRYVSDPSGKQKRGISWGFVLRQILGIGSGIVIGIVSGKFVKTTKP